MFRDLLETTFGLFYVMTEGMDHDGSAQKTRISTFLVLVDMGQVLRAIANAQYGWSTQSKDAIAWIDIVHIVTELLQQVIPRMVFFLTAVALIIGALADTIYVARIFKGGSVKNMLPVKILRFLVGAIVTTLFTTVLEWVLFPTECLLDEDHYEHQSLSELLHGDGASCRPFGSPEIAVTLPTILITAVYIAYSLITVILAFEINPLSRNPSAHSTGRVEFLWTAVKVAAIVLPYLSHLLSSVVVSVVLLSMACMLLFLHITHMPFHDLHTNVVRGGVYGSVAWLALSSVVASSDAGGSQTREWVLLAMLPVSFAAAAILVFQRQVRIVNFVHLLRGEFAALRHHDSPHQSLPDEVTFGLSGLEEGLTIQISEQDLMPKTVFDKFFDRDYERDRAFKTGSEALVVARTLLYARKKNDLPFLNYLVRRALVENPESEELLVFQFLVQRFIYHDASQSSHKNRLSKLQGLLLAVDLRYLLYAVNRRATQEFASAHLGKGAVSAISVMEFEGRMERGRKAHRECVVHMKAFWKAVRRSKRHEQAETSHLTIQEMIFRLGEYDRAFASAELEYEWLLDKYSGSVTMLNSYAHFCDAIKNDEVEAEKRRKQASLLESSPSDDVEEEEDEEAKQDLAAPSTATSESESARTQAAKYMQSWSHAIMSSEVRSLQVLRRRVRLLMAMLTVIATAGYAFTDFYLFRDIAKKNILLIDKTGQFRAFAIGSSFLLRSQMLHAHQNDTAAVEHVHTRLEEWAETILVQHKDNYEHLGSSGLKAYYNNDAITTYAPVQAEETWAEVVSSYWTLGNDVARRMERASRTGVADLRDPHFDPSVASPAKLSIAFLNENVLRSLVPAFEHVVALYDEQVQDFGDLTLALVYSNAALNALLVVGIAFFVLSALLQVIQTVQYKYISCWMALTLPSEAVKKLYRFYHDHEALIIDLESDGEDKNGEDNDDNSDQGGNDNGRDGDNGGGYGNGQWRDRDDHRDRDLAEDRRNGADQIGSFLSVGPYDGKRRGYRNRYRDEDDAARLYADGNNGNGNGNGRYSEYGRTGSGLGGMGAMGMGGGWEEGRNGRVQHRVVGRSFGSDDADEDVEIGAKSRGGAKPGRARLSEEGEAAPLRRKMSGGGGKGPGREAGSMEQEGKGVVQEEEAEEEEEEKPKVEEREDDDPGILVKREPKPEKKARKSVGFHAKDDEGEEGEGSGGRTGSGGSEGVVAKVGSFLLKKLGGSFRTPKEAPAEEDDVLERRHKAVEVSEEVKATIRGLLLRRQAWFSRRPVYVVFLSLMLAMCLFSILYPPRVVIDITNLGPLTNQADRRRYLTRACVHFSRELILNDGFMRMDKATLHGALAWHLAELRTANRAVRLGHLLGVEHGADWHNHEHNLIMYAHGCPWRAEHPDKDCEIAGQPKVTINGLYSLILNFYHSVEAVMSTYGVDPAEAKAAYERYLEAHTPGPDFTRVDLNRAQLSVLSSDDNLRFILEAFDGDLYQGLRATLDSFQHETTWILDTVHEESRLLYACYMVLVVVLFYGTLFRKTMRTAQQEAVKARGFVHKMPTYSLEKEETDVIRTFFQVSHV